MGEDGCRVGGWARGPGGEQLHPPSHPGANQHLPTLFLEVTDATEEGAESVYTGYSFNPHSYADDDDLILIIR